MSDFDLGQFNAVPGLIMLLGSAAKDQEKKKIGSGPGPVSSDLNNKNKTKRVFQNFCLHFFF